MLKRFGQWAARVVDAILSVEISGGIKSAAASGVWSIYDGADYRVPIPIPAFVSDQGTEAIRAYLGEAADAYRSQFASPYLTDKPFQMMPASEPLREWDYLTRRDVLEQCHLAWERNPLAKAAIRLSRQFSIGKGATFTYKHETVKELIEAFLNHPENDFRELEKSVVEDLLRDGELFARRHSGDGENGEIGEVVITFLPPEGIRYIKHQPGFIRRVEEYVYTIWQSDGEGGGESFNERIEADQVIHVAINRKSFEQRGRPELLAILPWLRAHKQHLENLARNDYFTNILYDVTLNNATAGQVAAKGAQLRQPPAGATIVWHNQNETWQLMDTRRVDPGSMELSRQLKLMNAAGFGLPEYMLSDGQNANLASATAQQLPALVTFADIQDIMIERLWRPIINKFVLGPAIERKELPEMVDEQDSEGEPIQDASGKTRQCKTLDAWEMQYPQLQERDPKTLAEALTIAVNNSWMSNETATGELPWRIEWATEQRRIQAEREKDMADMRAGLKPIPPFMQIQNPNEEQKPDGNEDEREQDGRGSNEGMPPVRGNAVPGASPAR